MSSFVTVGVHHPKHLFVFGLGYSATWLAQSLMEDGWTVSGTVRSHEKAAKLRAMGIKVHIFDGGNPTEQTLADLQAAPYVLQSVGLVKGLDPILPAFSSALKSHASLIWLGYLSTTVVYGDHQGRMVTEKTPPIPQTDRGKARLAAEDTWSKLGLPLHIFRLAGIYGPGRNPLTKIQNGKAQTILKANQVFSRIHVADIANLVRASMNAPTGTATSPAIYNGADDQSAPPQDVTAYAADLLGVERPPEIALEDAILSPMARSFYADNKRVSNAKMRALMGPLSYPTYREGLDALIKTL